MNRVLRSLRSRRRKFALAGLALLAGACSSAPSDALPAALSSTTAPVSASTTSSIVASGESWIAYEGPVPGGAGNRLVRPDGSGDHWATPEVAVRPGGWQLHPDWSHDGASLAFAVHDADDADKPNDRRTTDLWVSDPSGHGAERVFDCQSPCDQAEWPAWSPDDSKLAFVTWDLQGVNIRLALLDFASTEVTTVVTASGTEAFSWPRWSPDGNEIVLEMQRWPNGELAETAIAVVDLTEPEPTAVPITDWATWATYPDWHPTDDLIVFSTRPWDELANGPSNLFTIHPDGSSLTALTDFAEGQTRAVQPSWTPDGSRIIFTAIEGAGFGKPTMAIINRDGTGLTSATSSGPMFGTHPRLRSQG